jgi:hypothetical protein
VPSIQTPKIPTTTPTIPSIPAPTSGGGGGGGGVAKAASVAASTALTSQVIGGSFDAGSFRKGEEKDRVGTTINLTVTGAFDKEGTARTIVETLNSSYYRGTGGAGALAAI